jgi:hypothetical protein
LISNIVFLGLSGNCAFAESPTRRASGVNATKDGVIRFPISFARISCQSFEDGRMYLYMSISIDSDATESSAKIDSNDCWMFFLC